MNAATHQAQRAENTQPQASQVTEEGPSKFDRAMETTGSVLLDHVALPALRGGSYAFGAAVLGTAGFVGTSWALGAMGVPLPWK